MPSNKKRRIRERRAKTGEKYSTAKRQLDAAVTPPLPPVGTIWTDELGRAIPRGDASLPQVEVVNVQDFDGQDLTRAWVPETAFDDPSMPKRPDFPPGTMRAASLAEYIKVRERVTGWKLVSVKPHAAFMGQFLMAIITWDPRTKRQRGER